MVVLHTGLLVGLLVEVWVRRPTFMPALGWHHARARAGVPGAPLVVHRDARPAVEHPGDRRTGPAAGHRTGPYRFLAPPQLRRRRRRGLRAAAGARRLGHRAGLHGLQRGAADACGCGSRTRPWRLSTRSRARRRCATCSSRAAGRPAWRPRCTPRGPAWTCSVWDQRRGHDRQGLRRGADAGRGRRPGRPRGRPGRAALRRHPLRRRAAHRGGAVPRRPRARGTPDAAARGRCAPPPMAAGVTVEHRAVDEVEQDARRASSSTASGPATWSPPTGCTRRCAGCWAWSAGPARTVATGCAAHLRSPPWTSYVEVHWAPRGEAYVTPVADELVGVALLTTTAARSTTTSPAFPTLAPRLRAPAARPACWAPARCGSGRTGAGGGPGAAGRRRRRVRRRAHRRGRRPRPSPRPAPPSRPSSPATRAATSATGARSPAATTCSPGRCSTASRRPSLRTRIVPAAASAAVRCSTSP